MVRIPPFNELDAVFTIIKLPQFPNDEGISPDNHSLRWSYFKDLNWPSVDEIDSERWLEKISISSNARQSLISNGMRPVRFLLNR